MNDGRYDAIMVGSGHNGLISAAYLAKAGRRVLVLERRGIIGGATVTEEPWLGYRISTCSHVCKYTPNLRSAIEHVEVRGLRDIETRIRITGGNILHGEILPEKMFEGRPVPGYSGYRTPIENLCWVG
jgi:phytoene dehydrogenase-like protein